HVSRAGRRGRRRCRRPARVRARTARAGERRRSRDRVAGRRARDLGLPRPRQRAMARLPLRIAAVSDLVTTEVPLVDVIDRLLERGVVLAGGAVISVAGVELIELRLNVLLASVDAAQRAMRGGTRP